MILEAKVSKTKAGKSRKTTTKALLYVRWDEDLYEDGDEDAESWLEVIPKYEHRRATAALSPP